MIYTNPNIRPSNRDGYVIATFIADTVAELPATNYLAGYTLEMGCTCHVIENSGDYEMQSNGTWVKRIPAELANTYTRAEIDTIESDLQTDINAVSLLANANKSTIADILQISGKNRLTAEQTTQTTDTATITANGDGTYHVETSAPTTQQIVFTLGTAILHTGIEYIITGIANGSNTTFFLNYDKSTAAGTGNQNVYAGGYQITTGEVERLTTVKFYIRSGVELNVDISPMILEKRFYTRFPEFVPYQITLQDLYNLVKSYHP